MLSRIVFALVIFTVAPVGLAAEPIHDAAARGDVEEVRRLLDDGTPVDQFDTTEGFGRPTTALYRASMAGRTEVVELLLDAGADPTLRANDSRSVLNSMQVAAKFGREEILRMFLNRGFDPNAPGKEATPLHSALKTEKENIVRLLIESGASESVEQPSIAARVASGDPERGHEIYISTCQYCHRAPSANDEPTGRDRIANLWNVIGRDIGSLEGAIYSNALKGLGGVWTYDRLNSFMALPGGFVPGTMMEYYIDYVPPDEQDRIDLISYLRKMSDDPAPLP